MLHNVINCHHVSIALAIIIGVALQEYNNLPHQEPLNVIINVSNIEYFNVHTSLTALLMLP